MRFFSHMFKSCIACIIVEPRISSEPLRAIQVIQQMPHAKSNRVDSMGFQVEFGLYGTCMVLLWRS